MALISTALLISATTRSATYCWTRGSLASGPNVSRKACSLVSCRRVQPATTATGAKMVAVAMSRTATTLRHQPRRRREGSGTVSVTVEAAPAAPAAPADAARSRSFSATSRRTCSARSSRVGSVGSLTSFLRTALASGSGHRTGLAPSERASPGT